MRVTRESLIRIAKQTAQERAYNDQTIVGAYLTGSLISRADPMLGGTTDIDMVLVHLKHSGPGREIVKLTPDFHLDILHRLRSEFGAPRELRVDPLLGWELYDPMLLFQREKFFDFIQAGLRAGFEFGAPQLVLARCRTLYGTARRAWFELNDIAGDRAGHPEVDLYLSAVNDAANAVAELSGPPLAERRFLSEFSARAQAAQRPQFAASLFSLLGAPQIDADVLDNWLDPWKVEFLAAAERGGRVDARVHAARLNYYEKAIRQMQHSETPLTGLWPLIQTWTLAAGVLFEPHGGGWVDACHRLGLLGQPLEQKVAALDQFLDEIEARLDEVAELNGLETSTSI
jgi:hypothetical protein